MHDALKDMQEDLETRGLTAVGPGSQSDRPDRLPARSRPRLTAERARRLVFARLRARPRYEVGDLARAAGPMRAVDLTFDDRDFDYPSTASASSRASPGAYLR